MSDNIRAVACSGKQEVMVLRKTLPYQLGGEGITKKCDFNFCTLLTIFDTNGPGISPSPANDNTIVMGSLGKPSSKQAEANSNKAK
jgi:hypothetical protein